MVFILDWPFSQITARQQNILKIVTNGSRHLSRCSFYLRSLHLVKAYSSNLRHIIGPHFGTLAITHLFGPLSVAEHKFLAAACAICL